jgi:PAS domain S-box-containing protein
MAKKRRDPLPEQEAEAILDAVAEGLFTVDADWHITRFNRAAERITGVAASEAIGERCWNVFRTDVCESRCVLREALARGGRLPLRELSILDSRDRELPIEASAVAWMDDEGTFAGGVETFRDVSEIRRLRDEVRRSWRLRDVVTRHGPFLETLALAPRLARGRAPLLIVGPSGSGKATLGRALHAEDEVRNRRLVTVAPRDMPERVVRASVEQALRARDAPTLLVLHVDALDPGTQEALANALSGPEPTPDRARLIATALRDAELLAGEGRLPPSLAAALGPGTLRIPPLSERRDDVPLLVQEVLARRSARSGAAPPEISEEAMRCLMEHDGPDDVRGLVEALDHALALEPDGTILASHLPASVFENAPPPGALAAGQDDAGLRRAILAALERSGWNKVEAAERLGVSRATLWRRMRALDVPLSPP